MARAAQALVLAAFVALVAAWPGWHASEAEPGRPVDAQAFADRVHAFAATLAPDAVVDGGEVPLLARRFAFWPEVRLRAGQTYHLLLMAEDGVHSVVVAGREMLLVPGRVQRVTVTPAPGDDIELRCNEYCGLGHNRMRLKIY